jgi:hypothetical protein
MSQNKTKLSQVIRDFKITQSEDDFGVNVTDYALRNIALRGMREIGFDASRKIKSLKRTIDTNTDTIPLPDDFVDLTKVGIVDADGFVRVLGENKNINYSRKLNADSNTTTFDSQPMNVVANRIINRENDKTSTSSDSSDDDLDYHVFENYLYEGGIGRLYGIGGAHLPGSYRLNLDQNRIEIQTNDPFTEVVLEYIADEARSGDPEVHVYAEEALRNYMYYKIIERKSTVPANEKQRARTEFYNELRKAKARLNNFTKEEALKTIRKNFMQVPKY